MKLFFAYFLILTQQKIIVFLQITFSCFQKATHCKEKYILIVCFKRSKEV